MYKNLNLDKTYQSLLIMLAFLMPLTVFGANLMIVIICVLWLISGNYKSKFDQIINNKLMSRGRATPQSNKLTLPRMPITHHTLPHLFLAKILTKYEDKR